MAEYRTTIWEPFFIKFGQLEHCSFGNPDSKKPRISEFEVYLIAKRKKRVIVAQQKKIVKSELFFLGRFGI